MEQADIHFLNINWSHAVKCIRTVAWAHFNYLNWTGSKLNFCWFCWVLIQHDLCYYCNNIVLYIAVRSRSSINSKKLWQHNNFVFRSYPKLRFTLQEALCLIWSSVHPIYRQDQYVKCALCSSPCKAFQSTSHQFV